MEVKEKVIPKTVLFAVYGTLKKGHGNHGRIKGEGVEFMGNFKTEPKFTMESRGGFPAVYCTGDTSINCELYKVSNPLVIRQVYALEGYSGVQGSQENWYDVETIETPFGKASMFVFRNGNPNKNSIVTSGNW